MLDKTSSFPLSESPWSAGAASIVSLINLISSGENFCISSVFFTASFPYSKILPVSAGESISAVCTARAFSTSALIHCANSAGVFTLERSDFGILTFIKSITFSTTASIGTPLLRATESAFSTCIPLFTPRPSR